MKSRPNFTYKITRNGKMVTKCQTHSIRRFYHRIRTIKWQKGLSVYLRVNYGKALNNLGKMVTFYNDGDYQTRHELFEALTAFTEKDRQKSLKTSEKRKSFEAKNARISNDFGY